MRSRFAAGLVLLLLTVHAFLASATHFHRPARTDSAGPAQVSLQGREDGGQGTPLTGGDAQCLLCRLQRNFASGVPHAVAVIAPPPADALRHQPPQDVSARAAASPFHSGRAPPRV